MSFNVPEFTVSEFSKTLKNIVEDSFGYVRIRGEITGLKRAATGHVYFSLKDENNDAILSAVCFKNTVSNFQVEIADGLQVVASGKITTYSGRSNYQIVVEKIEVAGFGAIMQMLEKRRQKLAAEGLFDNVHKKKIPYFPRKIGVITSPTGAVIQDIIHRINDRFPTNLLIYPSLVQGRDSKNNIIEGIKFFNKMKEKVDILIIARGGGSFEDLLPFSDEDLVRAAYASDIAIISAIGHETDFCLLDYVADLRAPTPSAAAELATPVLNDLKSAVENAKKKLLFFRNKFFEERFKRINSLSKYIIKPSDYIIQINRRLVAIEEKFKVMSKNIIIDKMNRLNIISSIKKNLIQKIDIQLTKIEQFNYKIKTRVSYFFKINSSKVMGLEKLLISKNYQEILKRGFCFVKNKNNQTITSIKSVNKNQEISIFMHDGIVSSIVTDIEG